MDGRALWAESATGVPFHGLRSEYASVLQSASGGCRATGADPRACREQAARWLSQDLYPVTAGRRAGGPVNHTKVERIYDRDAERSFRRRRRKKLAAVPRGALPRPPQPGRCYVIDFVHDRLVTGRRFTCLTMTDPCSKEVPVIEVDVSIGGARICRILDRRFLTRPLPETLIRDNGPAFARTCPSCNRESRCRTPLSRASTGRFGMNV